MEEVPGSIPGQALVFIFFILSSHIKFAIHASYTFQACTRCVLSLLAHFHWLILTLLLQLYPSHRSCALPLYIPPIVW